MLVFKMFPILTVIIRAIEICMGPNISLAGRIYETLVKLITLAIANKPSAML